MRQETFLLDNYVLKWHLHYLAYQSLMDNVQHSQGQIWIEIFVAIAK